MNDTTIRTLASAIGADAVRRDPDGRVHALPPTTEAVAAVLGIASNAGWRVAVAGAGTWQADDAPADVVLSLRALDAILGAHPADLLLTAQAGAALDHVRRTALDTGTWVPIDAPGRPDRTVGSVLATATSGPLRHGFGPVRDQVLGLTVVTGDGRVIRAGGTTVKNVAGFDLVKLHVGGFGGFGVITECHLRLRALPRADTTWVATGDRDRLTAGARQLTADHVDAIAMELLSPALAAEADWLLAVRIAGGPDAVSAESGRLALGNDLPWQELPVEQRSVLWSGAARAMANVPTTLRLGVLPEGLDTTVDLVVEHLGEGLLSAGAGSGSVRWGGDARAPALRELRAILAQREIPLTLERAPWSVRSAVGHFGAYREGVGGIVERLRESFDPHGILLSPLGHERSA